MKAERFDELFLNWKVFVDAHAATLTNRPTGRPEAGRDRRRGSRCGNLRGAVIGVPHGHFLFETGAEPSSHVVFRDPLRGFFFSFVKVSAQFASAKSVIRDRQLQRMGAHRQISRASSLWGPCAAQPLDGGSGRGQMASR